MAPASMCLEACDFAPRSGAKRSVVEKGRKGRRLLCGGESRVLVTWVGLSDGTLSNACWIGVLHQPRCRLLMAVM